MKRRHDRASRSPKVTRRTFAAVLGAFGSRGLGRMPRRSRFSSRASTAVSSADNLVDVLGLGAASDGGRQPSRPHTVVATPTGCTHGIDDVAGDGAVGRARLGDDRRAELPQGAHEGLQIAVRLRHITAVSVSQAFPVSRVTSGGGVAVHRSRSATRAIVGLLAASVSFALLACGVAAASITLFEPPLFHPGSVNGQSGVGGFPWKSAPPGAIPSCHPIPRSDTTTRRSSPQWRSSWRSSWIRQSIVAYVEPLWVR